MTELFDDLVGRLTQQFTADPELKLEIAQELRGHLEDSAADFAGAGMDAEQSRQSAVKALGDESEITKKLWDANHRRMQLRKAARWTFGITAGPVAAVALVSVGWGAIVSILVCLGALQSLASPRSANLFGPGNFLASRFFQQFKQDRIDSLAPDSRTIFTRPSDGRDAIEWGKNLAGKNPTDPVFQCNYIMQILLMGFGPGGIQKTNAQITQSMLDATARGSQLEPQNAFYPFCNAMMYLAFSGKSIETPAAPSANSSFKYRADWLDQFMQAQVFSPDRWEVNDPASLQTGLDYLHTAAQCTFLDSHALDFGQRRIESLPTATTFADQLMVPMLEITTLLPHLNPQRQSINIACSAALDQAALGHADASLQIMADCRHISLMAAQRSRCIVELMVAEGMYDESLGTLVIVYQQLKMPGQAQAAQKRYVDELRYRNSLRDNPSFPAPSDVKLHGDVMTAIWFNFMSGPNMPALAPGREAEYAVIDHLGLTLLAALLLVLGTGRLGPLLTRAGRRRGFIFIGWRRLAIATAIALIPVGLYAIYIFATSIDGRDYGARVSTDRLLVEYAAVAAAVLILVKTMADRAIRQRATEIGADLGPQSAISVPQIIVNVLCAVTFIAYLFIWNTLAGKMSASGVLATGGWGLLLVPALILYGLVQGSDRPIIVAVLYAIVMGCAVLMLSDVNVSAWGPVLLSVGLSVAIAMGLLAIWLSIRGRGDRTPGAFNMRLSAAPIFLTTALAVLAIGGPLIHYRETSAVTAMNAPGGSYDFFHEIDYSRWSDMKARLSTLESVDS